MNEIFIEEAHYVGDYKVKLLFNDKRITIIDFENFLNTRRLSIFKKYKEIEKFKQFKISNGNIVWGKNWDLIFPIIELYEGKIKLK